VAWKAPAQFSKPARHLGLIAKPTGQGDIKSLPSGGLEQGDRVLHLATADVVARRLPERFLEQSLEVISAIARNAGQCIDVEVIGIVFVDIRHDSLPRLNLKATFPPRWCFAAKKVVEHVRDHRDAERMNILGVWPLRTTGKLAKHIAQRSYQIVLIAQFRKSSHCDTRYIYRCSFTKEPRFNKQRYYLFGGVVFTYVRFAGCEDDDPRDSKPRQARVAAWGRTNSAANASDFEQQNDTRTFVRSIVVMRL